VVGEEAEIKMQTKMRGGTKNGPAVSQLPSNFYFLHDRLKAPNNLWIDGG
jgi:uncharacterized protein YigE (DUF2233 family)